MPGHKGSALYRRFGYGRFLEDTLDYDITEIPGADDLFVADGIIGEVQERYAELYGAGKSYLMVNGTSGALLALILTCVPRGGKMIIGSNSHRAVLNGLALAGAEPVYVDPVQLWGGDVEGPVDPEQVASAIAKAPDASAVLITSPNYYGIASDIKEIARITHEAGMVLIVDQAHGAHLAVFDRYGEKDSTGVAEKERADGVGKDSEGVAGKDSAGGADPDADGKAAVMPSPAERLGADIVTCSIHKTMASMTQSAVLHVISDRIDTDVLEEKLWMVESSSPSYILMTSLEINADIVEKHGAELISEWNEGLDLFYSEARKIKGLRTLYGYISDNCMNMEIDRSKIVLDMGMPAEKLESLLMEKGIFCEKKNGSALVCLSGIGNTKDDYSALVRALGEISRGE